jgi:hypothetical protein
MTLTSVVVSHLVMNSSAVTAMHDVPEKWSDDNLVKVDASYIVDFAPKNISLRGIEGAEVSTPFKALLRSYIHRQLSILSVAFEPGLKRLENRREECIASPFKF